MFKFLLENFNLYIYLLFFFIFFFYCLILYFIKKNKVFLINRLNYLLEKKVDILLILLFLVIIMLLLLLVHLFFYIYMYNFLEDLILEKYYLQSNTREGLFLNLLFIDYAFSSFSKLNIISTIIIIIISYIINLILFYYIFIDINEKSFIYVFIYIILFFILLLFIFICIFKYNIYVAYAMIKNNNNLFFSIDLQTFGKFKFVTKDMLENKSLLIEALKLKGRVIMDNKEAVFCYNNKNDLYNYSIIKNNNVNFTTNIIINNFINRLDFNSQVIDINTNNCKCVFLRIEKGMYD